MIPGPKQFHGLIYCLQSMWSSLLSVIYKFFNLMQKNWASDFEKRIFQSICMIIVLFCGISTFRKLRTLRHYSKRTTNLQNQLFKALVTQTIIPVVTMFIPAAVMMLAPLFEVTLGSYEVLVMPVITTYPCVDPIVVIFFVKDYRQAIWQTIRCKRCLFSRSRYSLRGTAVSFITEASW